MYKGKRVFLVLLSLLFVVNNSLAQSTACAYQRIELHIKRGLQLNSIGFQAETPNEKDIITRLFNVKGNSSYRITVQKVYFEAAVTSDERLLASADEDVHIDEKRIHVSGQDLLTNAIRGGDHQFPTKYRLRSALESLFNAYTPGLIYTITNP